MKRNLSWFLVLLWLLLALFLSGQPGEDTAKLSLSIAAPIAGLLNRCGLAADATAVDVFLRKLAHPVLFGVLGLLFQRAATLTWSRRPALISSLCCTAVAVLADVQKLWIAGRHLQWDEVGLNVAGAIAGVLFVAGLTRIRRRKQPRAS